MTLRKIRFALTRLLFLGLLVLGGCGPAFLAPHELPSRIDLTSAALYKELNGIERILHREIRQTAGTQRSTTPINQLMARHDLSPGNPDCPIYFGQANVQPVFSDSGPLRGAPLDEVSDKIRRGELKRNEIQIEFIWVDGKKVTMNNRGLTALYRAGVAPTKAIDRSGNLQGASNTIEDVLRRLDGMGGKPSTEMLIRGKGLGRDGKLKEASDWDAPIGEVVSMPEELLRLARDCRRGTERRSHKVVEFKLASGF